MALKVSDEVLGIVAPTVVYWLYSGIYVLMGPMAKHRLFTEEEETSWNLVTKREVVLGVLQQQALQIATFSLILLVDKGTASSETPSLLVLARQLLIALLVLDAWQYWGHRFMHLNKYMYQHFHARHHRLIVPYPFAALYNHPVEGFLLDTVGGALAFVLSGMSPRVSMFFFSLATIKTVDDHCGLWLPKHPFHRFFRNNAAFHAVHHQLYGGKCNFSAPFLVLWDRLLGTYLPYTVVDREDGGYEIRPAKRIKHP